MVFVQRRGKGKTVAIRLVGSRMIFPIRLRDVCVADPKVGFCGRDVLVTQHTLNNVNVRTTLKHMGGKASPKYLRPEIRDADSRSRTSHDFIDSDSCQTMALST